MSGWGNIPDWNEGKLIRKPFRAATAEEKKTARYFYYFIQKDDRPRPIPKFMVQTIESVKGPEKRKGKSSDREPLNWLLMLKVFENDFFLAATGLLILKNFSKGTCCFCFGRSCLFGSDMTPFYSIQSK